MENKKLDEHYENKQKLNEQIKDYLLYTGFAMAIISALSYIILAFIMIKGFSSAIDVKNQLVFSILGAAVGLVIAFSLKQQGIAFAKQEKESKTVMTAYYDELNKSKKEKDLHTITHYLVISTIKDIFIKGLAVAISTYFILNIFREGSDDWSLLGLAISNIFLFIGFGLMALSTSYDKYIQEHIPVIKALTSKIKERNQTKVTLDLANIQLDDYGEKHITQNEVNEKTSN